MSRPTTPEHVDLLVSAGRGPDECAWAVAELVVRLTKDAARHGLATRRLDTLPGPHPGTHQSVLLRITGPGVAAFAATWTGTLCWQAPSPYRPEHRRKNWYVTARPCDTDPSCTPFDPADVDIVACRTGGPGGQRRNKVSTAARATHRPTGQVVVVDAERHFDANRRLALELLRRRLGEADAVADRAAGAARRHLHDELVRGDPIRVERPPTQVRIRGGELHRGRG